MGTPAFQEYIEKNEANFYKAYEEHEKASALRKQKRAKKRSRPVVNVDESDEDVPLIQQWQMNRKSPKEAPSHSQETYTSLFVDSQDSNPLSPPPTLEQLGVGLSIEQRPESRRAPLEQSTDDGETSSLDEPVKSLTGELAGMTKTNPESRADKSLNLGNSILSAKSPRKKGMPTPAKAVLKQSVSRPPVQEQLSKPSRTLEAPIRTMTPKSVGLQQDSRRLSESATQFPSTKSANDSNLVRQKTSVTNTAVSSSRTITNPSTSFTTRKLSGSATSTAIRRSGTASKTPIKMTNEPKAPLRKGWQNSDKHYNKMKYRHRADLKSRSEGAPDLNALSFVGTEPPGLFRHKAPDLVDNPYGRREVGNRRIQEPDVDEYPRRESVDDSAFLHNWEADKVPLVCPYWRLSSNCSYGPQKCRFMHRHKDENGYDYEVGNMNGYIPPKYRKPPLTCPYWLTNKVGCKKLDAECDFAHTNTGWILPDGKHKTEPIHIDPNALPISDQTLGGSSNSRTGRPPKKRNLKPSDMTCWYWTEGKCHNAPKDCAFQHFDTGYVADPPPSVLTCRFWLEGTCLFAADDCKFQHINTGIVSGQPSANPKFTTVLPREGVQHNQAVPTPTVRQKGGLDVNMHDGGPQLSRPWESPPVLLEQSQFSPVPLSPSVQTNGPPMPPLQPVKLPATSPCLHLNENIEKALKINFVDLFEWGRDEKGKTMLDRRVLLLYHPVDHAEDLEVITRWLLMHHVEVSSPWFQGCWDHYQQQLDNGGSGIVIAHPDLEYYTELPGFGQLLRKQVRLWSFGIQEGTEHNLAVAEYPPEMRHDCIEIFPVGGLIYITDDVFEEKPQLALEIIKLFFAKIDRLRQLDGPVSSWLEVDDAGLLWRLCVRPELMAYLLQRCEEEERELAAGDPNVIARAELYTLLSDTNYIEQDSPVQPLNALSDNFPVMSERRLIAEEEPVNYFDALAHSRQEANLRMIRYYASLQIDMRRDYRHFFVVHTDPSAACVAKWKQEIQSIGDVITPEQCISELSMDGVGLGKEQLFDFYERFISELEIEEDMDAHDKQVTIIRSPQVTTSQMSLEDGEIPPI